MKLIVGLGNPGEKYHFTRHNAGFLFLEYLAHQKNSGFKKNTSFSVEIAEVLLDGTKVTLIKPQLFMNRSGDVLASYATYYKIPFSDIVVVHDDLDIRLGEFKIAHGRGPKVHYGINSIEEKLGSKEFLRVRLGVDNRGLENRIPGESYVLEPFSFQELETFNSLFEKVSQQLRVSI